MRSLISSLLAGALRTASFNAMRGGSVACRSHATVTNTASFKPKIQERVEMAEAQDHIFRQVSQHVNNAGLRQFAEATVVFVFVDLHNLVTLQISIKSTSFHMAMTWHFCLL